MLGSAAHDDATSGSVVVRRCTEADLALLEAAEPPGSGYARGALARQVAGDVDFLVAVVDGAPLASAELTYDEPPELKNLSVEEAARGRGVGTALVRAAEAMVEERVARGALGQRALVMGVGLANPRAAALYERLGYRRTGVQSSTTYSYVDGDGLTRSVTEHDEELLKRW